VLRQLTVEEDEWEGGRSLGLMEVVVEVGGAGVLALVLVETEGAWRGLLGVPWRPLI
jgi:hypothetical protein